MERRFEMIDVIVAIGMSVTILAGGLLFMAANGQLAVMPSWQSGGGQPSDQGDGTQWLQPVLGQAIVNQVLLERHNVKNVLSAKARLSSAASIHRRWLNSPFGYLDSIRTSAARAEADHAVRVQGVMGRSIVNFTRRGVRSGVLSPVETGGDYNARMIGSTNVHGQQMDNQFRTHWQSNVGRAIVSASQHNTIISDEKQERLGGAIVQLTLAEAALEGNRAAVQEQVGITPVEVARMKSQSMFSGQPHPVQFSSAPVAVQQSRSALPASSIVLASLILMSLFAAGLLVSPDVPVSNVVGAV